MLIMPAIHTGPKGGKFKIIRGKKVYINQPTKSNCRNCKNCSKGFNLFG